MRPAAKRSGGSPLRQIRPAIRPAEVWELFGERNDDGWWMLEDGIRGLVVQEMAQRLRSREMAGWREGRKNERLLRAKKS